MHVHSGRAVTVGPAINFATSSAKLDRSCNSAESLFREGLMLFRSGRAWLNLSEMHSIILHSRFTISNTLTSTLICRALGVFHPFGTS
jgi:hypothetical protein